MLEEKNKTVKKAVPYIAPQQFVTNAFQYNYLSIKNQRDLVR